MSIGEVTDVSEETYASVFMVCVAKGNRTTENLKLETTTCSTTSATIYKSSRRHFPEDLNFNLRLFLQRLNYVDFQLEGIFSI
jgi:hypothetical protein